MPTKESVISKTDDFKLTVPVSASQVADYKPGQGVKVLVAPGAGAEVLKDAQSQTIKLDEKGNGVATFTFSKAPGDLRLVLGPADANDEELLGLQTITQTVSAKQWKEAREVKLTPILISPFYWQWWLRWCRVFTIHGRVVCADGSPVPGAQVCAYDVDWWWWWHSSQQVGCATTDINGAFTISFRWCCGFWPWWWWLHRVWRLDPFVAERIMPLLQRDALVRKPPIPDPSPDLNIFRELLPAEDVIKLQRLQGGEVSASRSAAEAGVLPQRQSSFDPTVLADLRESLLKRLPQAPELERLFIWPWWPWQPWFDCNPDILFRVTQNCHGRDNVIVQENIFQTRWDIPTNLSVTLTANSEACCLPQHHPDPQNPCVVIETVCGDPINHIGGNIGTPAPSPTPAGFLNPNTPTIFGDRPYGGNVLIQGLLGNGVDYYEFEWSNDSGATWNDMPAAAVGDIPRQYIETPSLTFSPDIPFLHSIDGRLVYESRQHYEATHSPLTWNVSRFWMPQNYFSLTWWLTSLNDFSDGTYRLRAKGWTLTAGHLTNRVILPICDTHVENGVVIAIDNRLTGPASGHPASVPNHLCGGGSLHICTMEPDTDVIDVRILHADHTETPLTACGNVRINNTDVLRVDFLAYDRSEHLAYYSLDAHYGENMPPINLLGLPGATLAPLPGGAPPVPQAVQVGPSYHEARTGPPPFNGTAPPPIWAGGAIRLEVPAHLAFPQPCCYLLVLNAFKRTVVNCDHGFWAHSNVSEYSFTIG